jgi:hypothetical protein
MTTRSRVIKAAAKQAKLVTSKVNPKSKGNGSKKGSRNSGAPARAISQSRSKSAYMARENSRMATSAAQATDSAKPEQGSKQSGESLDKVRDILFGSQSREYDKRFSRLEERLIKEASDLRDDLKKRFDTLETYIKKEVESLTSQLKSEHSERSESAKEISRELKETGRSLEKKTVQLDEQLTRSQRELRQQILEQSKSISDEIRQKQESMSAEIERATSELRDEKTDRALLAALFMEIAMRLNNEFKIPGAEALE